MKVLVRNVFFCLLVILSISCNKKEKNGIKYLDIKISDKAFDAQLLIESKKYVKLETNSESIIGEIVDIKYYKDRLYILEETGSMSRILVFANNGKFMFQLGSYGRGPEEIDNPRSFCFLDSSIFVWDRKKIHHLNLNNKYLNPMFDYFVQGGKLEIDGNNFIIYHGAWKDGFVSVLDFKGDTIKSYRINEISYDLGFCNDDMIIKNNNQITFYSAFLNKIYTLSNDGLDIKYQFNYSHMKSLMDILPKKEVSPYELMKVINLSEHFNNYKYFDNDEYLILSGYYNRKLSSTVVKKSDWSSVSFAVLFDKNTKLDLTPDFLIDQNRFCKVINIFELTENKKGKNIVDENLNLLINSSKIDDNPILVLYSFKK